MLKRALVSVLVVAGLVGSLAWANGPIKRRGGGGGGLDAPTADLNYLRLDASNDPVTGKLDVSERISITHNPAGGGFPDSALAIDCTGADPVAGERCWAVLDTSIRFSVQASSFASNGYWLQTEDILLAAGLGGANIECGVDDGCAVFSSGFEGSTAWLNALDDSDGEIDIGASLQFLSGSGGTIDTATGGTSLVLARNGTPRLTLSSTSTDVAAQPIKLQSVNLECDSAGACDVATTMVPMGTVHADEVRAHVSVVFDDEYVGAAPPALPTCDSGALGTVSFQQETGGPGAEGSLCLCRKDGGSNTYAWESLNGASCL